MAEAKIAEIIALIEQAKNIGFITHLDGDGDAFGSMLGLARICETLGKKTVIFSNEPLNPVFEFLADEIDYQPVENFQKIDLLIGLDANTVSRFTIPAIFTTAEESEAKLAIIDHHEPSEIGHSVDLYWGDQTISSASEMVYQISKSLHLKLDKTTATLILLGIETDTFSLQFENSKPVVFLAVADLLNQGARLKPIIESAFGGKPLPMVKLLGRVLDRLELTKEGIAVSYVTEKDKKEIELGQEGSSGVANFLDQMAEAKVVMVFEEIEGGYIKVSLRSNNSLANVAEFGQFFGGGGHKKAAGFRFKGRLDRLIPDLIRLKT